MDDVKNESSVNQNTSDNKKLEWKDITYEDWFSKYPKEVQKATYNAMFGFMCIAYKKLLDELQRKWHFKPEDITKLIENTLQVKKNHYIEEEEKNPRG